MLEESKKRTRDSRKFGQETDSVNEKDNVFVDFFGVIRDVARAHNLKTGTQRREELDKRTRDLRNFELKLLPQWEMHKRTTDFRELRALDEQMRTVLKIYEEVNLLDEMLVDPDIVPSVEDSEEECVKPDGVKDLPEWIEKTRAQIEEGELMMGWRQDDGLEEMGLEESDSDMESLYGPQYEQFLYQTLEPTKGRSSEPKLRDEICAELEQRRQRRQRHQHFVKTIELIENIFITNAKFKGSEVSAIFLTS